MNGISGNGQFFQIQKTGNGIAQFNIGILHLGTKTARLRKGGVLTIGDLSEIWPIKYPNNYGLGPGTLKKISDNYSALKLAYNGEATLEWEQYAEAIDAILIPTKSEATNGSEFVREIPRVLGEIATTLNDPVDIDILLDRLSRAPKSQKTLDEIGSNAVPPVTRERIRQKEKKLLTQISEGLLWDEYGSLNVLFRPEFSTWWRKAAEYFGGQEEIGFQEFITGLCDVWKTSIGEITAQIPIILAIVTGKVQMPKEFRPANSLDSIFFTDLPESTLNLPLNKLRLGKAANQLADCGYETIGNFVEGCFSGDLFEDCNPAAIQGLKHFNLLKNSLSSDCKLDWKCYANTMNLPLFPSKIRTTSAEFARHVTEDLSELIGHLPMPARADKILNLRVAKPAKERLTLEGVARILGTHGPSIKREETVLLEQLNDVLFSKDFSRLNFWLSETFLSWWEEAEAIYSLSENDYGVFGILIGDFWELNQTEIDSAQPALWAVINGYPSGKPVGKRRKRTKGRKIEVPKPAQDGRIRLTGFRRVH